MLPNLFRKINARLMTTHHPLQRKLLKVIYALSVFFYRNRNQNLSDNPVVEISNFDSDIRMMVDRSRSMGASIYWTGFHEFREFIFLHRFLTSSMTALDVGANQGEYTLFLAKRLVNGRVISFEPLPSILSSLKKNIALNTFRNIMLIEAGASDRKETLTIYEIEDANEGLGTLYPGKHKSNASYNVPLVKIDEVVQEEKISRVDFIKMDIEGGELKALHGAEELLKRDHPLCMVEINETSYSAAGYHVADVGTFFKRIGYQPFTIGKNGNLVPCTELPEFGNIVFKYN